MVGMNRRGKFRIKTEIVESYMRKANGFVMNVTKSLYERPGRICGIENDAAVHLTRQTTDVHEPSMETHFAFGITRHYNVDATNGIHRAATIHNNDLTGNARQEVVDNVIERGGTAPLTLMEPQNNFTRSEEHTSELQS